MTNIYPSDVKSCRIILITDALQLQLSQLLLKLARLSIPQSSALTCHNLFLACVESAIATKYSSKLFSRSLLEIYFSDLE